MVLLADFALIQNDCQSVLSDTWPPGTFLTDKESIKRIGFKIASPCEANLVINLKKNCWIVQNRFIICLQHEMANIPKSNQSQNTRGNYKIEIDGLARTPGHTGDGIRCLGEVSIPCRPATSAVRWDQVPRRTKLPMSTGHIRREVGSGA
jgi:hypothetical protein